MRSAVVNPLAMVVCGNISLNVRGAGMHLHQLMGTVRVTAVPVEISFSVYASVSELRQRLHAHFRVLDADENLLSSSRLKELPIPADPLDESTIIEQFEAVEFRHFGSFFVQLWINGQSIMERRILIVDASAGDES